MECKKCKAQLEQGVTRCPECGTDNAPEAAAEAAAMPAAETAAPGNPEIKAGITFTPGKLVAVIAAVVVLTAVVVALIMHGMGYSFNKPLETEPVETLDASVEASGNPSEVSATIPADGNPENATCKGSYTASEEEVVANMSTVIATVGDAELTNAELQIYYWLQIQSFLGNYGSYAPYMGLDYTRDLATQLCGFSDTNVSWQQYFLAAAVADWHNYQSLAQEAKANGFVMDEEYSAMIESLPETLATDAGLQGFASAEEYLSFNVGPGATIADYQEYMRTYYQGFMYFQSVYESLVPTEEELEAYFKEHEQEYAAEGVNMEDVYVDVRHILVLPEGATLDTIRTETFSEEAWAAGEENANYILQRWLDGDTTEDGFAALANEFSQDPGSNTNGGLYTDVYVGQMVEEFEAWCFDEARQPGDYGIVRTSLGYHIMYFSSSRPAWKEYAREDIMSERGMELIYATTEKYPMTIDYSKVLLGNADLSEW